MKIEEFPHTTLGKYTIFYTDHQEFSILKKEIFAQHCYQFKTNNPTPLILDIGAHIGLATLYFKQLYPGAIIECFEPHPDLVPILEHNIWVNELDDVTVHPIAFGQKGQDRMTLHWDANAPFWLSTSSAQPFYANGNKKKAAWEEVTVPAQPISEFLENITTKKDIDVIKLDVEGAESPIISDARPYFSHIKRWLIEFHPHQSAFSINEIEKLMSAYTLSFWRSGEKVTKDTKGLVLIEAELNIM